MPEDAVQILKEDHKKVQDLFKQFEDAGNPEEKKAIVDHAIVELEAHALLEEEIVYPALRRLAGEEDVDEAEEEHHVASMLMEELMDMQPQDARYDAKFTVLSESVRHHIQEEEKAMLPKLGNLGGEELMHMADRMTQRREEFLEEFQERRVTVGAGVEGDARTGRAESGGRSGARGRGSRGGGSRSRGRKSSGEKSRR